MREAFLFSLLLLLGASGVSWPDRAAAAAADWETFEKRIPRYELEPEERELQVFCGKTSVAALQRVEPGSLHDTLRKSIFQLARIDQSYRGAMKIRARNEEDWGELLRHVREAVEEAQGNPLAFDQQLPMLEQFHARFALNRCQIEAYRARALETAPVRRAAEEHYRGLAAALASAEARAERICQQHPKQGKDWQRCQDAANFERGKLRSQASLAKKDWERLLDPPDYGSELPEATPERLTPELARAAFEKRLPRFELQPGMLGDEVRCGHQTVRKASQIADPLSEFQFVMSRLEGGPRYREHTKTRYEHQLEKIRSQLDRASYGVPPSQLDAWIEELETLYGHYQQASCSRLWFERRAQELAWLPAKIESEYRDADAAYQQVSKRCDELKPEGQGWIRADARARAWVECTNTSIEEHNRRLGERRRAQARWDEVQRATDEAGR